jgi:hypothetical protein
MQVSLRKMQVNTNLHLTILNRYISCATLQHIQVDMDQTGLHVLRAGDDGEHQCMDESAATHYLQQIMAY